MSRIGKQPIPIPGKTKVELDGQRVTITGPKGSLVRDIHPSITACVEENSIIVRRSSDQKKHRALHGLTRALLNNMVVGVTEGFSRELRLVGVGYRAELTGKQLILNLGYSHPIVVTPPDGISFEVEQKAGKVTVLGIDKELVGLVAEKIRSFRKPEPYKGKGVRYADEHVRSKAGKTAASGA
ncbi:MAG: 50S ribosomal protein L6 [Candidatus Zixiibacteriota bacterium]